MRSKPLKAALSLSFIALATTTAEPVRAGDSCVYDQPSKPCKKKCRLNVYFQNGQVHLEAEKLLVTSESHIRWKTPGYFDADQGDGINIDMPNGEFDGDDNEYDGHELKAVKKGNIHHVHFYNTIHLAEYSYVITFHGTDGKQYTCDPFINNK